MYVYMAWSTSPLTVLGTLLHQTANHVELKYGIDNKIRIQLFIIRSGLNTQPWLRHGLRGEWCIVVNLKYYLKDWFFLIDLLHLAWRCATPKTGRGFHADRKRLSAVQLHTKLPTRSR